MSLEIVHRPAARAIGLRYAGKNENQDMRQLWTDLVARMCSLQLAPEGGAYGVCRCIPGDASGAFEYIGAFAVAPDAPVPEGMVAVEVPAGEYFSRRWEHVTDYMACWNESFKELTADGEWAGYCQGPMECQCADHPSYEYYPPEFNGDGPMVLCVPVRRK